MTKSSKEIKHPFSAKIVRTIRNSFLPRGKGWLTFFLARRLKSLQAVPIDLEGVGTLRLDLRHAMAHGLFMGATYEPDEQDVMRRFVRDGNVAFDIGAHFGCHTVLLSHLVGPNGKVCSFEPNMELLPTLGKTVQHYDNVSLFPYALSNQSAESILFVTDHDHSLASLTDWTIGRVPGKSRTIPCEQRRLDDLIQSQTITHPDFIKCDAEGAELLIFQGGRKTLDIIDAPIIMFEANVYTARGFGNNISSAMEFLSSLKWPKYNYFEVKRGGALQRVEKIDPIHSNVLAVPHHKMCEYPELSVIN